MSRAVIQMTIDDVTHLSEKRKQEMIEEIPEHERESRLQGVPMLGRGRIYQVAEERIKCDPFEIPSTYYVLAAMDFGGMDHPFAGVKVAWHRDSDRLFVTQCYREKGLINENASGIRQWGAGTTLLWSWPRDGMKRDPKSGVRQAELYREEGLNMREKPAEFANGGYGVEDGIAEILNRMRTGRFFVFSDCFPWFEEFRLYHRDEDGKIVKVKDDVMDATRYAVMDLRFAQPELPLSAFRGEQGGYYDD